ncbi:4-hydroxy-tetrahydrodipicolinate synthase [Anaerohalosphaera lusitana]|uniref:4-hydroxy-tetrahydrodipicolinate synthase n=1 Tax=Anaerohalosphaera lusitana TaxID=1936003 RepID=A0A1U9NQH1_9BACT|nr:4-hydroxy-tetrahydrodipicolinate synthase [Anaerohalosphaera lusitana]AQT69756.1 4-hydroxy-tetrahydrodipicolinate synthase [Anaerohalosphaera lusitana]
MFKGSYVAIITPFKNGEVDYETLEKLVNWQIEQGINGLVPVGTTGESPTLNNDEHKKVIETVVKAANGRVPVIAGAGSNSTAEAVEMTEFAKKVGADATLQVGPYYNKPEQEGFYQHFKTIAEAVDLPVILYNIPGRCGAGMTPETIARLADVKNVVAVKEATGSLDQASEIALRCDITILSGDDSLTLPLASVGGQGVISVIANIIPADVRKMTDLILEGKLTEAREWHKKLFGLGKTMLTMATNPIPVKTACSMLGMCTPEMRLPMTPLEEDKKQALKKALQDYGLDVK